MSYQNWRQQWVSEKCKVAVRLSRGEAGGGYAESAILVCSALSALSAELWVGRGIDRYRFIEMLARYGTNSNDCKTVSIPLFVQHLKSKSMHSEALKMQQAFSLPNTALVLTGPDVDKSEEEVLNICPQLDLKEIRSFSYASIMYSEIRSSYAHEYRPGEQADSWPMTMRTDQRVSYVNRVTDDLGVRRLVHFHFEWFEQLAVELASSVDNLANTLALPLAKPLVWWAEGG
jgi:hypothetical protein